VADGLEFAMPSYVSIIADDPYKHIEQSMMGICPAELSKTYFVGFFASHCSLRRGWRRNLSCPPANKARFTVGRVEEPWNYTGS
jgi:hypothetical protein